VEQVPQKLLDLDSSVEKKVIRDLLAEMRGVSKIAITRIVSAMIAVIDVILFNAHKAYVTNEMHLESIRESYRELTEKNRQLEEMNEHINEFERLKANFLSTVSHELRTPLTSIIGYSDMLFEGLAGELGQEQKQFVQTIKTKGDELLKLISSILDFSRFETGHLNLRRLDIDPKELVEKSVANNVDLAKRRGIRLLLDVPGELPTVSVDPERIETSIDHLIENAIKFSTPGAMVKVSAKISPPDEDATEDDGFGFVLMASPEMLEISVEDWGIGISEIEQDQIFAPFSQIDNSSTREQGGAGLGLAVVKHFVEAHGGQVKIQSRAGEGSQFSLWLPMIKEEES
jgi:signal transduction histidine kinase